VVDLQNVMIYQSFNKIKHSPSQQQTADEGYRGNWAMLLM
jgi:hypothetical protein